MVTVRRKPLRITPDARRVVARYYMPGAGQRVKEVAERILQMSSANVSKQLKNILNQYSNRHRSITTVLLKNFERAMIDGATGFPVDAFSEQHKLVLGAYFTMEYSIESAAFFNPSIVEAPDQSGVSNGERKVILSFRAVGEGHISSLAFREGVLDKKNNLKIEPSRNNIVDMPEKISRYIYEKEKFIQKMQEMELPEKICKLTAQRLKENFIYGELRDCLEKCMASNVLDDQEKEMLPQVLWLARSHYELSFTLDTSISERVIFPVSYRETNGIEDVRFDRFVDEAGEVTYYGTYTAYNGITILPKLLETKDFYNFKIAPVHGPNVQNKGLAFFPRKINGNYVMLARIDGVNNYIMFSDDINVWLEKAVMLQAPEYPWEFIQVGNCGSPLETPQGWLLITHGVGPMRQYCLGAMLLDLENPTKIIGRLKEPFLIPNSEEREGYVPNVVYSCGSIINGKDLIVPYAMSDYCSSYVVIPLKELLQELMTQS
jgi:predicted GH43/DUF377 family glycosyl hydrolase